MSVAVRIATDADPMTSWRKWADFGGWPDWNPACLSAEADGPPQPGTRLRLQLRHPHGRAFWTAPVITRADPGREIAWETRAFGFRAPTGVRFDEHGGGSLITLESDARGPLAFTYRMTFPEKAQALLWSGALTALAASLRSDRPDGAGPPFGETPG